MTLLFTGTQCSWLFWWRKKPVYNKGVFQVKLTPSFGKKIPVRARAYETDEEGARGELVANQLVTGDGVVGFVLPLERDYIIEAHADLDADGRQDRNEPLASIGGLRAHDLSEPDPGPVPLHLPGAGARSQAAPAVMEAEPAMPGLGMPAVLEKIREQTPGLLKE